MKKNFMNAWCSRAWIKFASILTFIMTAAILLNNKNWSDELKIIAAIAALIPVHVIEEWVFPGGFHFQYNLLFGSKQVDRYPMCRLSDMFTNLIATFFYIAMTVFFAFRGNVPSGALAGTAVFCALEVVIHTAMGIMMYFRFKSKGKTTIYGAGSITAYLGFGVIGILSLQCLSSREIGKSDWFLCFGILAFIAVVCILIPENLIKNKNSPYYFESAGYYERFISKQK